MQFFLFFPQSCVVGEILRENSSHETPAYNGDKCSLNENLGWYTLIDLVPCFVKNALNIMLKHQAAIVQEENLTTLLAEEEKKRFNSIPDNEITLSEMLPCYTPGLGRFVYTELHGFFMKNQPFLPISLKDLLEHGNNGKNQISYSHILKSKLSRNQAMPTYFFVMWRFSPNRVFVNETLETYLGCQFSLFIGLNQQKQIMKSLLLLVYSFLIDRRIKSFYSIFYFQTGSLFY